MVEIKRWLGLRNTVSEERFKVGELTTAVNVDLDNTGAILTRQGLTKVNSTPLHSLHANHLQGIAVSGQTLVSIEQDYSLRPIKVLTSGAELDAEFVGDVIYYSNGSDTGRLLNGTWSCWGVVPPIGQPQAAQAYGDLPPGRYLYALTFVRWDGHESGTGVTGAIDVTQGGINFTQIEVSSNSEVQTKRLYLSAPNGETPYFIAEIPNAATGYLYNSDTMDMTIPLVTQFASPPPAGTLVRFYNGMMYVVVGDTVYYSDPYNFGLFRLETNYLRFPGLVVMFEAVNDGLYVGTHDPGQDNESAGITWFLHGERPDKMDSTQLFDGGVIDGTAVKTDAAYFDNPVPGSGEQGAPAHPIVVWTSRHGICTGRDGGEVKNLTEEKFSFPSAQRGAAIVRQQDGYATYIVTLQGPGGLTNSYTSVLS